MSLCRSIIVHIFLLAFSYSFGQNPLINSIPVAYNQPNLLYFNIADTTISAYTSWGCGTQYYTFDIDGNGLKDLNFELYCYMGGLGATSTIKLDSEDSCYFMVHDVIDTAASWVIDTIQYQPYSFPIVRPYTLGEMISWDDSSKFEATHFTKRSQGWSPNIEYYSVDNWVGLDAFIGFKKIVNGEDYLGWIHVFGNNYYTMELKDFAISGSYVTNDVCQISVQNDGINIFGCSEECQIAIYSFDGHCLFQAKTNQGFLQFPNTIKSGLYFISVTGLISGNVSQFKNFLKTD